LGRLAGEENLEALNRAVKEHESGYRGLVLINFLRRVKEFLRTAKEYISSRADFLNHEIEQWLDRLANEL
jgi:hypothetical protein